MLRRPWTSLAFAVALAVASLFAIVAPTPVHYATSNGTATASVGAIKSDYEAASGDLTFQPGEGSKQIAVVVNGDTAIEQNETFLVTLTNPTGGAAIGDGQATGAIENDDNLVLPCSPRPHVDLTKSAVGGKLQVHVATNPKHFQQANPLVQLRFGAFQNGRVTFNGQQVGSGQTVNIPANATTADFAAERATTGQPTTVPLTVVDSCGEWTTFVGGGAGAGF